MRNTGCDSRKLFYTPMRGGLDLYRPLPLYDSRTTVHITRPRGRRSSKCKTTAIQEYTPQVLGYGIINLQMSLTFVICAERWIEPRRLGETKQEHCQEGGYDMLETPSQEEATGFDLKNSLGAFTDKLSQAEYMQKTHPILYDSGKIYWAWSWDDRSYHMVDETDILIAIKNATGDRNVVSDKSKGVIMESIRVTGRERGVKELPPNYIQFKNGVVDILTGEQFQATPEYMFTSPIPHNIGESDETPYIDKLFTDWVGGEERITLYEMLAYCFYQGYPIARIFALYGNGRNGKSQFLKVVNNLIGKENTCSTSLDLILSSRFETGKLYKKRAAFVSETDFAVMRKTAMLKRLSGDDMIGGEFKGKGGFDFWNYAKMIIATNNLPETDDKTDGFYSRWIVVDFPNQFDEGRPVIDVIPEWEYENLCFKLVGMLKDLLARGKFCREGTIKERMKKYEQKSTPVQHFITDCCVVEWDETVKFHLFYKELESWMEGRRYRAMATKSVTKWLRDAGYESKWERWGSDKKYLTFYGLRLKTDDELGMEGSQGSVVTLPPPAGEDRVGVGYQDNQGYQPQQQSKRWNPDATTKDYDDETAEAIRAVLKTNLLDGCGVEYISKTTGIFPATIDKHLTSNRLNVEKVGNGCYRMRGE